MTMPMITKTDAARTIGPKVISTPSYASGRPSGTPVHPDGPAPLQEPNRGLQPVTPSQLEVNAAAIGDGEVHRQDRDL